MTVTLPGGPGGPSFSLAPRLCNGFLGCSFQALVEPRQFSWQVVLFHTPGDFTRSQTGCCSKTTRTTCSAHTPWRALEAAAPMFWFSGGGRGTNTTAWEAHSNNRWIVNILKNDISKSMMKPNIFTSMTTIKKPMPNNRLQLILFNISNTSWSWKYRPKVNQRNAVLLLMMMIIAAFLSSSFRPLSVQAF